MKKNFLSSSKSISKDFHASDLFNRWKTMVKNAERSIKVFTPYLDETINKLFDAVDIDVERTIITCLEGDNLFQRGYQLIALKKAMNNGCTILNLSGLHAKILLVDDEKLSIGSQNFTNRGRKNKEAGFVSKHSFEDAKVLETLSDWELEAEMVTEEMLDALIEYVDQRENELGDLAKEFGEEIEKIKEQYAKSDYFETGISNAMESSSYRLSSEEIRVDWKLAYSSSGRTYLALFCPDYQDLTAWLKRTKNGEEPFELERLYFYPCINVGTQQMAFIRIAHTRLTYVRHGALRSWSLKLKNDHFDVETIFPKVRAKKVNCKYIITGDKGVATLWLHFNGISFDLQKEKYNNDEMKHLIKSELLEKPKKLSAFYVESLKPFRYRTQLDFDKIGIKEFAKDIYYDVRPIEYKGAPIIVLE